MSGSPLLKYRFFDNFGYYFDNYRIQYEGNAGVDGNLYATRLKLV